jgi:hypothetical protein
MNQEQVPLTPAEQMRRIREAVQSVDLESPNDAYAALAACFSRLDVLHERITDLENKMLLREQPFVSPAPLIGPLIVRFRSVWNWMSTKWYVLPLIDKQNEFNAAASQTFREILIAMESLTQSVHDMQICIAKLDAQASTSSKEQPEE